MADPRCFVPDGLADARRADLRAGPAAVRDGGRGGGADLHAGNTSRLPKFYLLVRDTLPRGVAVCRRPAAAGPEPVAGRGRADALPDGSAAARRLYPGPGASLLHRPAGPANILAEDAAGFRADRLSRAAARSASSWLRGAAAQGWRGKASALTRGAGETFTACASTEPGDELRHVHWRTTARTGTLAVTEYAQGVTLDVVVALDLSRAAYAGTGEDEGRRAGMRRHAGGDAAG